MPRKSTADYPDNWESLAKQIKDEANWKCVRCGHPHDPPTGYTLTVHHLDLNPSNNAWWNTPALCQRCHLTIQGKVIMARIWMFEHSNWFKPYVAGFYAHIMGTFPKDRKFVESHADEIIKAFHLESVQSAPIIR